MDHGDRSLKPLNTYRESRGPTPDCVTHQILVEDTYVQPTYHSRQCDSISSTALRGTRCGDTLPNRPSFS
jgi:hypothetical protein